MSGLSACGTFAEQLVEILGVTENHVAALVEVEALGGQVSARGAACNWNFEISLQVN